MDKRLIDWIIKNNAKSTRQDMQIFLRMLKFNPRTILDVISDNINHWGHACARELKKDLKFSNSKEECRDLLHAFQNHYAKELAMIKE